jgi:hypothetical protein
MFALIGKCGWAGAEGAKVCSPDEHLGNRRNIPAAVGRAFELILGYSVSKSEVRASFSAPLTLLLTLKQTAIAPPIPCSGGDLSETDAGTKIASKRDRERLRLVGAGLSRLIEPPPPVAVFFHQMERKLQFVVCSTEVTMEKHGDRIIETAVEARAGFLGRPVLLVLVASCVLAAAVMVLAYVGVVKI